MPQHKTMPASAQGSKDQQVFPSIKVTNMNAYYNMQFAADVDNFKNSSSILSGYSNIDAYTNLYAGLYVIGAVSSLGKTTFIHQMGEQIAESGMHVLFFSLEQSTFELASKSIARSIAKAGTCKRMSSLEVRNSDLSNPDVVSAIDRCRAYSDRITIIECSFRATIDDIASIVYQYIKQNNVKPVVIIDYLQVIQPAPDSRMTTKDQVDYHARRLKELQTDCQITMIVISSFNRQNYMNAADFESFKESGGIEYTADVVWALQLQCINNEEIFSKANQINEKRKRYKEAKKKIPRKVELICLKNRFGISSYSCLFDYYPNADWFKPDPAETGAGSTGTSSTNAGKNTVMDGFKPISKEDEDELPWSK